MKKRNKIKDTSKMGKWNKGLTVLTDARVKAIGESLKGKIPWNKKMFGVIKYPNRKRPSIEDNEKLSKILLRGKNSSYCSIHNKKYKREGYPVYCIDCGKVGEKHNGRWNINWSNNSGQYLSLDDFSGRCNSCHLIYDNKQKSIRTRNNLDTD